MAGWSTLQAHHVGRRHLGRDLDMAGVEQSHDLAVDRQRLALVGDALADHAVERRAHLGVGQVLPGDLELGLGDGDHRGPVLGRRARLVGGGLRDDVAVGERLLVGAVARRPAGVGAGGVERRLALVDLGLQLGGLETRQQLVLGHLVAFADQHFGQPAGDAGLHDRLVDRLGGAGEAHDVDQAARLDGVQFGRDQLERPRSPALAAAAWVPTRLPVFQAKAPPASTTMPASEGDQDLALGVHGRSPLRKKSR